MQEGQKPEVGEDLFAEATRWFFRLRAENVIEEDRRAFEAWLNQDAFHYEAWKEVESLSVALHKTEMARSFSAVRRNLIRPAKVAFWLVAPVAIALAVLFVIPGFLVHPDFQTAKGQRQAIVLADGTTVDLDSDTALTVKISDQEREITVLKGEAYFEVAKDRRPFRVISGQTVIRDIGTEFDISRGEVSIVSVKSGLVDVSLTERPERRLKVLPGQAIEIEGDRLSEIRKVDFDQITGWRHGKITFSEMKLSDVVSRLNRYRPGRIVIINPGIKDARVSGSFDVNKPDAALEALKSLLGIQSITLTSALTLLH